MASRNNRRRRQQKPGGPHVLEHPQLVAPGTFRMMPPVYLPGPLSVAHWVAHQTPGQLQLVAVGGESKLERLAGQIAARLAGESWDNAEPVAKVAVDLAEAVLKEIAARAQAESEANQKGETDGESRPTIAGTPDSDDTETTESRPVDSGD